MTLSVSKVRDGVVRIQATSGSITVHVEESTSYLPYFLSDLTRLIDQMDKEEKAK